MTTIVNTGALIVSEDLSLLDGLFAQAPAVTAFHARVMVGRWFARHRREWVQQLPTRLRKMARRGAYLFYVDPDPKAVNDLQIRRAIEADPDLDRVGGKGVVRSDAALLLERGGTVRPRGSRFLAVPTGKYRRMSGDRRRALIGDNPTDYNQSNPENPLFALGRRRRGSRVVVLGRRTGRQLASGRPQVEAAYLLVPQVNVPAQLGVVKSWDALSGYRGQTLQEATQRIVVEMAKRLSEMPRTATMRPAGALAG